MNKTINGNNSKRPTNISKLKTILERSLNDEKFPTGPTILNPGPTLFKQVTTEDNVDAKSKLSSATIKNDPNKIRK